MFSLQAADYILLTVAAFASSIVSGLGGFGGAFILVIVLTPIVGAKSVVPLISIFAVFNNLSRLYIYRQTIRWRLALHFTLASLPGVYIGANFLALIPERAFLVFLGTILLSAIPVRRYLKTKSFNPGVRTIAGLGLGFGLVSGAAAGAGMLVVASLSAVGLQGPLLLGTDAAIGIVNAISRAGLYWHLELLNVELAIIGLLLGAFTLPGSWVSSLIVNRLGLSLHTALIECLILGGGSWMVLQGLMGQP